MFGYIRTYNDELKLKDLNRYRACYCGLCKNIAQYGQIFRLLLSYDITFFVLLSGCDINSSSTCKKDRKYPRCHGSLSCFAKCNDNSKLNFWAAVSVLLQYQKVEDDVIDGNAKMKLLLYLLKKGYLRAKRLYPNVAELVEHQLLELHIFETKNCTDLAQLQECFARIFKDIIQYLPDESEDMKKILGEISYHVAAWVYLLDMYDDREKDRKEHNFNPLLQENFAMNHITTKEMISNLLIQHMEAAKTWLQILPYSDETAILENIFDFGMPTQMRRIGLVG